MQNTEMQNKEMQNSEMSKYTEIQKNVLAVCAKSAKPVLGKLCSEKHHQRRQRLQYCSSFSVEAKLV